MDRFWRGLGEGFGGFLGLIWWILRVQEGIKIQAEKEDQKRCENFAGDAGSAAWRWAPGREDLGPELALMSSARHSTLPLEGGGGSHSPSGLTTAAP